MLRIIITMLILDYLTISLRNLWNRKLRTFLTTFAIIIGATLIALVFSVVTGLESFFNLQMETFSDPRFIELHSQKFDFGAMFSSFGLGGDEPGEVKEGESTSFIPEPFTDEKIKKVSEVEGVEKVVEWFNTQAESIRLKGEDKKYQAGVMVLPKFMQEKVNLVAGRYVDDDEIGKIVVASQYMSVWDVDGADDLVGKRVIFELKQEGGTICPAGCVSRTSDGKKPEEKEIELEIVGVSEKTILSTLVVVSPAQALEIEKFRRGTEDVLNDNDDSRLVAMLLLEEGADASEVEKKLEDDLGHNAETYDEQKNQMGQIFDILKYFLSAFGVIAMVVASLGIINTLFMAIYERTREIGVMKAVGATKLNILILFTVEAALLGIIGGVLGMFTGVGIAELANWILHGGLNAIDFFESIAILKPYETLSIGVGALSLDILIAPILSAVVAIVAGLYPSWRASRLDPIDALGYE